MGYTTQDIAQFIPPTDISADAGTLTLTVASNVWFQRRTAADGVSIFFIPVNIPSSASASGNAGAKLTSVEIMYRIGTAAADAVSATIVKDTFAANGTLNTAAVVTTTYDTGHDAAAERLTLDEHRLVLTVTTPEFLDNDAGYHVELTVDNAATTVTDVFGAICNFTLQL